MSAAALALVVAAAVAHATWNLYAKRAGAAGVVFLWLYTAVAILLYAPLAAVALARNGFPASPVTVGFVIGSVVIHTAYFTLLQRGYATGDLSVVYPVARGLGPVLAIAGGVAVLGERPSVQALTGGAVVCAAIIGVGIAGFAASGPTERTPVDRAMVYAVLTGTMIATYTLWDAYAVSALAIQPLVFNWLGKLGRLTLLSPLAWHRRARVGQVWRRYRKEVLVVAALSPVSYILVLTAFTLAPVSYVAPVRELSIVIGAVLGALLLGESQGRVRIVAAAAIVVGVALVATG